MLLAVEPDLHKFEKEPMVFAVYGRGRAMPPYVGKGITQANLVDCIAFLAGACSCMVKDENPGVDLLMRWDWDATAERMAAEDEGSGLGSPGGYGGYQEFAQDTSGKFAAAGSPDSPAEKRSGRYDQAPGRRTERRIGREADADAHAASGGQKRRRPPQPNSPLPSRRPSRSAAPKAGTVTPAARLAARQAWTVGIGLALGAIVVVAAGLLLSRRGRPL